MSPTRTETVPLVDGSALRLTVAEPVGSVRGGIVVLHEAPMARQAPGPCGTCGFWLPLAGSLRSRLGACGNVYSPADGRVVTVDYGCGAHSQATLATDDAAEVVRSARYDTGSFDVL